MEEGLSSSNTSWPIKQLELLHASDESGQLNERWLQSIKAELAGAVRVDLSIRQLTNN